MHRLIIAALALSLLICAVAWGGGIRLCQRRRYAPHHSVGLFRLASVRRR